MLAALALETPTAADRLARQRQERAARAAGRESLGLEHRHYNASLISFDDLVGFPVSDGDHGRRHPSHPRPATLWDAQSVSSTTSPRCKPEVQNKLFSIVHERRVQGLGAWRAAPTAGRR